MLFSRLESELNDAAAAQDRGKLSSLLADDFEQRTPGPPMKMDPLPRQAWIEQMVNGKLGAAAQVSHMAVRTFSDSCVVDLLEQVHAGRKDSVRFVVDVWRGSEQGWKLAVRYMSDAQSINPTDHRPSGKQ